MAIDIFAQNTTTLSSGSALQLGANVTTPGIYSLTLNLSNMASGDVLTVTVKRQSVSAGAFDEMFTQTFTGAQSVAIPSLDGFVFPLQGQFFIQQTGGTLREYDWIITQIDA